MALRLDDAVIGVRVDREQALRELRELDDRKRERNEREAREDSRRAGGRNEKRKSVFKRAAAASVVAQRRVLGVAAVGAGAASAAALAPVLIRALGDALGKPDAGPFGINAIRSPMKLLIQSTVQEIVESEILPQVEGVLEGLLTKVDQALNAIGEIGPTVEFLRQSALIAPDAQLDVGEIFENFQRRVNYRSLQTKLRRYGLRSAAQEQLKQLILLMSKQIGR